VLKQTEREDKHSWGWDDLNRKNAPQVRGGGSVGDGYGSIGVGMSQLVMRMAQLGMGMAQLGTGGSLGDVVAHSA
jgi:hypothetical protein